MAIKQAVKATALINPKYVIPMRYDTFPVISANPEEFKKQVEMKFPKTKVEIIRPSEFTKLSV